MFGWAATCWLCRCPVFYSKCSPGYWVACVLCRIGCHYLLLPLHPLRSHHCQRHTRHLQPLHHPITHVLLVGAVLPRALRREHQLRHHAQAAQRAIRISHLHAAPKAQVALGPGLPIGSGARANAMQVGDKSEGIGRGIFLVIGVGRIAAGVHTG